MLSALLSPTWCNCIRAVWLHTLFLSLPSLLSFFPFYWFQDYTLSPYDYPFLRWLLRPRAVDIHLGIGWPRNWRCISRSSVTLRARVQVRSWRWQQLKITHVGATSWDGDSRPLPQRTRHVSSGAAARIHSNEQTEEAGELPAISLPSRTGHLRQCPNSITYIQEAFRQRCQAKMETWGQTFHYHVLDLICSRGAGFLVTKLKSVPAIVRKLRSNPDKAKAMNSQDHNRVDRILTFSGCQDDVCSLVG